jgi:hypothetical protein
MAIDPLTGALMTAIAAQSAAILALWRDNKGLHTEIKEILLGRAEASEHAAEKLAEASRLARESRSILKNAPK